MIDPFRLHYLLSHFKLQWPEVPLLHLIQAILEAERGAQPDEEIETSAQRVEAALKAGGCIGDTAVPRSLSPKSRRF